MVTQYDAVIAKTHTAEYSMHKYWARKPHNVLSYFISNLVPSGGNVLDPFCGSGVVLHESRKLGINAVGFDVNPIANLITKVLINPPSVEGFVEELTDRLNTLENETTSYYDVNGDKVKYLVHEIVVKCPNCGKVVSYSEVKTSGRNKKCPDCNENIRFNLENLIDTKVRKVFVEGCKTPLDDAEVLEKQMELSKKQIFDVVDDYNHIFATNRRILSFEGMDTSSLFTKRNFSVLCYIANSFSSIKDDRIRNAAMLLLTGSVAQCSRLIPNRNDLTTGGPAWSVPGFWVPAEHLETNPIVHLKARYKKFIKALHEINFFGYPETAVVEKIDAIEGMKKYRDAGKRADLIFFDPPYGDSVPYLEFSAMWNSFLRDYPPVSFDISVSDRISETDAWLEYNRNLDNVLAEISKTLSAKGKLLITFNNNDIKAWKALINGLQNNHLVCEYVTYQVPAVVSSKAQFSLEGSYISDIYSVYSHNSDFKTTSDLTVVKKALEKAAASRGGIIAKNLANRVVILEWLRNNISANLLSEKESLIKELFDVTGNKYVLKGNNNENSFWLKDHVKITAKELLNNGSWEWNEFYKTIAIQYAEYGFLDPNELRAYLDGHVIIANKRCIAYID